METLTRILERIGENFAWSAWMFGAPVDPRMFQRRPELRGSADPPEPRERPAARLESVTHGATVVPAWRLDEHQAPVMWMSGSPPP